MTMIGKNRHPARLVPRNEHGQSAVEYLVVVAALVSALVAAPSAFDMVREMLHNKYRGYSFGVAISDPPTSAFDDKVKRDANAVKEAIDTLHKLEHFVEHPPHPEFDKPEWPDWSKFL